MRGGESGMTDGRLIFFITLEVVKVTMTLDIPVSEFDQEGFVDNLATFLGIDPTRIRVAAVNPVERRLSRLRPDVSDVSPARRTQDGGINVEFDYSN